jgi:putative FmdB family regulatory protein
MPNYDFNCPDCEHEFTENVPIANRDDARACPSCGKSNVKRRVSAVRVSYSGFKENVTRAGSGWNDVLNKVKKASGRKNTIKTR